METILIIAAVGALNVVCFFIGAKLGQAVAKGEKVELPSAKPMKVFRGRKDRTEADAEQERVEIIMQNIENYDGTGSGQKDVPRG